MKKIYSYFGKHVMYNSMVHVVAGMGIGVLLVSPVFEMHTVRWGIVLLGVGILGHLYPLMTKK